MSEFFQIVLGLCVIFGLLSIARDIVCWPFKINNRIDLMQKMIENQEKIISLLSKSSEEQPSPQDPTEKAE